MVEQNQNRPDPDQLLNLFNKEQEQQHRTRGFLKIFLGYVAGVGKTYRMLQEAQAIKQKGEDIIIGIVETHGRAETEQLIFGLERSPLLKIEYQGMVLDEFNLDYILKRKPKYVLVDELAHTNVPGSRHVKRFQDIEELLNNGISVYTTLNIQHIESVNDIIYQITKIEVKETVPDRILELADKIALVDLPVEELLQRLTEGKVYMANMAKLASQNYFKEGTLLALRELALRYTAKHVDDAMLSYMQLQGIKGPWPVGTRIMVCISPSPLSEQPVRVAHRLAEDLKADWFAVYVEPQVQTTLDPQRAKQLEKNFNLAKELGGKIVRLSSNQPADEVVRFARSKNASLIIVGFSGQSRFRRMIRGSLLNQIIDKSNPIQVLVVGGESSPQPLSLRGAQRRSNLVLDWRSYLMSLAIVGATTLICFPLHSYIGLTNVALLFIIPVILSGIYRGLIGGLVASLLSVLCFDFFFVPPIFTFTVSDMSYLPTFFVMFLVGIVTSLLADRLKRQSESSRTQVRYISLLNEFSQDLYHAIGFIDLLDRISSDISEMFACDSALLLPDKTGKLTIRSQTGDSVKFNSHEMTIALWVFEHKELAGRETQTLSSSAWRFIPLNVKNDIVGVLAIGRPQDSQFLSQEQDYLLESFLSVISLAIYNYSAKTK